MPNLSACFDTASNYPTIFFFNIIFIFLVSYYLKGCYKDARIRAMPKFMGNFKEHDHPIKWCLETVLRHGYQAFGMQYGGECWSGPTAHITYSKYGVIRSCKNGLGSQWANSVYFFGGKKINCDSRILGQTLI